MGIAFQKLNGAGTVPGAQLEQLEQINQMIGDSGFKPEIWKLARMFAPDVTLTPVQFVVDLTRDTETEVAEWFDGNLYYGKWSYSFNFHYPASNLSSAIKYAILEFFRDGNIQQRYRDGAMGDSNYPMQSQRGDFIGFADFIRVRRSGRLTEGWNCVVEFQGFVLGEGGGEPPEPVYGSPISLITIDSGQLARARKFRFSADGGAVSQISSRSFLEYVNTLEILRPAVYYEDSYLLSQGVYPEEEFMEGGFFVDENSPLYQKPIDLMFFPKYYISANVNIQEIAADVISFSLLRSDANDVASAADVALGYCYFNNVFVTRHNDGRFWVFVDLQEDKDLELWVGLPPTSKVSDAYFTVDNGDGTFRKYIGSPAASLSPQMSIRYME